MKSTRPAKHCLATLIMGTLLVGCGSEAVSVAPDTARPVNILQLNAANQRDVMRFSGEIESHQASKLAFRVPGTVEKILVREGEWVKAGQVIARLDPHDFQVNVNETKARLSEARAAHKLAQIELKRTRLAAADNAVSGVNVDRAISAEARARANVTMLQQSLKKASDALRYSQLTAPFDGVIGQRFIDEFEQTAPGLSVVSLHQPNQLEAVVDVPENQIAMLKKGMAAQVQWYQQDSQVKAVITEIATLPDTLKQTYEVTLALTEPTSSLFPGKTVNVQFEQAELSGGYCLPTAAVKVKNGVTQVVTVKQGSAVHVPVNVVSQRHDSLCVEGALQSGDKVVTAGSMFLKEGDALTLLNDTGAQS
ncbi:efflux RND transporter periplasmic adaptor subunit [Photobacterium ganghwense]|uniref:efflux RND transporter periplasmic adaptor subunit n=1 Tax=Photobacterium ganghwense TaxID=320778 RepID=UPI001C2D0C78|nr:efflux RND transporter periplasmic adaptor subunit [Photobacterium ganghwense]MBV1839609.1 efflux RND transporter periplasmic adaptor subunit [Photobacterium ganghwense]